MAVPKKKTSRQRKKKRRTHYKLESPRLIKCPRCGATTLPHRVCDSCGYYKNEKVIEIEE